MIVAMLFTALQLTQRNRVDPKCELGHKKTGWTGDNPTLVYISIRVVPKCATNYEEAVRISE